MKVESAKDYQYCPVCFRSFPMESKYWLKCPNSVIVKIVNEEWYNEDYKLLILNTVMQHEFFCGIQRESERDNLGICIDCNIFFQKKESCMEDCKQQSKRKTASNNMNCKHSMCVFVEYVLSGGISVKPCNSFIFQATQSLLKNFPENPLLQIENGTFLALMGSVKPFCSITGYTTCDLPEFICVIKWIFCGASSIIVDSDFAKKMRHYFRKNEGHDEWWKSKFCFSCRFCSSNELSRFFLSENAQSLPFDLVIASGKKNVKDCVKWILEEFENIEKNGTCVDYVCSFCVKCGKYSVLHHDHDYQLQSIFQDEGQCCLSEKNIPPCTKISFLRHYTNKIIQFKKKKMELSEKRILKKRKLRKQNFSFYYEADN